MPINQYCCNECSNEFEILNLPKISFNNDTVVCPECKSSDVIKQIAQTSFKLKGSCWANDGYTNKK